MSPPRARSRAGSASVSTRTSTQDSQPEGQEIARERIAEADAHQPIGRRICDNGLIKIPYFTSESELSEISDSEDNNEDFDPWIGEPMYMAVSTDDEARTEGRERDEDTQDEHVERRQLNAERTKNANELREADDEPKEHQTCMVESEDEEMRADGTSKEQEEHDKHDNNDQSSSERTQNGVERGEAVEKPGEKEDKETNESHAVESGNEQPCAEETVPDRDVGNKHKMDEHNELQPPKNDNEQREVDDQRGEAEDQCAAVGDKQDTSENNDDSKGNNTPRATPLRPKPKRWGEFRTWPQIPGMDKNVLPQLKVRTTSTLRWNILTMASQTKLRALRKKHLVTGINWPDQQEEDINAYMDAVSVDKGRG